MSATAAGRPVRPGGDAGRVDFPLFDPLRALAATSILFVHVAIFTGALRVDVLGPLIAHMDIGVPFFFLLSAFLLYRPFVAARVDGRPRGRFTTYAKRRFVRIAPAYWLALTVAGIVPGMAGVFGDSWWAYYGLLQNYPVFTPDEACLAAPFRCAIPPAWSLGVEVAFYATLPLFVLFAAWLGRLFGPRRWPAAELVVLAGIAAISVLIQSSPPSSDLDVWLFFSPLGRGWWFGLGLALAAVSVWAERREGGWAPAAWIRAHGSLPAVAGVVLYVLAALFVFEPRPTLAFPVGEQGEYVFQYLLFGLIALLVMLPATFGAEAGGIYRRALGHRWMAWLGLVSYGIFLWQFPVMVALRDVGLLELPLPAFPLLLACTFAVTVACAAASYYLLERPLLRRFRSRRALPPAAEPPAIPEDAGRRRHL